MVEDSLQMELFLPFQLYFVQVSNNIKNDWMLCRICWRKIDLKYQNLFRYVYSSLDTLTSSAPSPLINKISLKRDFKLSKNLLDTYILNKNKKILI